MTLTLLLRAVAGLLAAGVCAWGYWRAHEMGRVRSSDRLSDVRTLRAIKRRLVIGGLKGMLIVFSAVMTEAWLNHHEVELADLGPMGGIIILSTYTSMAMAALIMVNPILDVIDRNNAADADLYERFHLRLQKRRTDPAIGQPLSQLEPPGDV